MKGDSQDRRGGPVKPHSRPAHELMLVRLRSPDLAARCRSAATKKKPPQSCKANVDEYDTYSTPYKALAGEIGVKRTGSKAVSRSLLCVCGADMGFPSTKDSHTAYRGE